MYFSQTNQTIQDGRRRLVKKTSFFISQTLAKQIQKKLMGLVQFYNKRTTQR